MLIFMLAVHCPRFITVNRKLEQNAHLVLSLRLWPSMAYFHAKMLTWSIFYWENMDHSTRRNVKDHGIPNFTTTLFPSLWGRTFLKIPVLLKNATGRSLGCWTYKRDKTIQCNSTEHDSESEINQFFATNYRQNVIVSVW